MTLIINPPAMLDDFPLMPHTRQKLEMILSGTIKFPEQKKGLLLYGTYGTGKTTMAELLPGWIETAKTTSSWKNRPIGELVDATQPNYDLHPCAQGQNGVTLIGRIQAVVYHDFASVCQPLNVAINRSVRNFHLFCHSFDKIICYPRLNSHCF